MFAEGDNHFSYAKKSRQARTGSGEDHVASHERWDLFQVIMRSQRSRNEEGVGAQDKVPIHHEVKERCAETASR